MTCLKYFHIKFTFILLFLVATTVAFPQSATLNVTTVTTGSGYNPYHVLAVWITDINGNNLRTIDCRAGIRIVYLTSWKASFKGGATDAVSGATLSTHAARSYVWNYKSRDGGTVPDGMYYLNVEFSEGSGSKTSQYLFTKSSTVEKLYTFPNTTFFNNVSVQISVPADAALLQARPNFICYLDRSKKELMFDFDAEQHQGVTMDVYDVSGNLLIASNLNENQTYSVRKLPIGIYLVKLTDDKKFTKTFKIVLR